MGGRSCATRSCPQAGSSASPPSARPTSPPPPPQHDDALSLYLHQGFLRKNSDWYSAFKTRPGFDLEAHLLEGNVLEDLSVGIYASLGVNNFSGKSDSYRTNRVEVDDMLIWTAFAGFRVYYDWGDGFFSTGSLGLGFAHYPSVDETVTNAGVSSNVEVVQRCYRMAADAGFRVGYRISSVSVLAGLKFRFVDNPELGDDAAPDETPLDSLTSVLLEVGAQIDF